MNDLTARMALVAEMDNEAYGNLRRQEEKNYELWQARRKELGAFPNWHWTDGGLVAEYARPGDFWPPNMSISAREQLTRRFATEMNRLFFTQLMADYDGDSEEVKVAIDGDGWLFSAPLCHRLDAMIRSSNIRLAKSSSENGNINSAKEQARRLKGGGELILPC